LEIIFGLFVRNQKPRAGEIYPAQLKCSSRQGKRIREAFPYLVDEA
jgi:hypothetical protein